jgi:hypothetical protein
LEEDKASSQSIQLRIAPKQDVPVFNLEVLVFRCDEAIYRARLANLELEPLLKSTPRDAIAAIVTSAKDKIREWVSHGEAIPWRTPSTLPDVGETRMLVPMHL